MEALVLVAYFRVEHLRLGQLPTLGEIERRIGIAQRLIDIRGVFTKRMNKQDKPLLANGYIVLRLSPGLNLPYPTDLAAIGDEKWYHVSDCYESPTWRPTAFDHLLIGCFWSVGLLATLSVFQIVMDSYVPACLLGFYIC